VKGGLAVPATRSRSDRTLRFRATTRKKRGGSGWWGTERFGAALARGSSRAYLRILVPARGGVLGILAVLLGHVGREVASGEFKSRPRRRRDDFHRGLTRRASGTRTAGRATSRDGRAVRIRTRAARRTSEANETRYTPRSARAACGVECDELAIFVTHRLSSSRERRTPQLAAGFFGLAESRANCPSQRKVSLSISVCLPKARAALDARTIFALHTNRLYLTRTPTHPWFRSFHPGMRRALMRKSRLVSRSHGSNERRRHLVPRASFLR
jgi:hypothetical protein